MVDILTSVQRMSSSVPRGVIEEGLGADRVLTKIQRRAAEA